MADEMGQTAGDLVAQGVALMRVENEQVLRVAVERPRKEEIIVAAALKELDIVPEEAQQAFYSIPYRERQPDGSYKIVKVEGPSIKTALALARRWGNCIATSRVVNEDDSGFDIEGVFIDMETNFRVSRPFRVQKAMRTRKGQVVTLDPQRQVQAIQSGASKAMRNAILAGLPAYLTSAYYAKARSLVAGNEDAPAPQPTKDAVLRTFAKLKPEAASQEQLENYVGISLNEWTGTQIADLRGLWNALNDGQITTAEAFGVEIEMPRRREDAAEAGDSQVTRNESPAAEEPPLPFKGKK